MKRRAFAMSFMQVFSSPVFYLSAIGVTFLCFISIWERISASEAGVTVYYSLDIFIGLTMLKKLVVLFAALPYVASFCSDWKFQYIKPVVIRTGIKKYVWSKIFTCFVSGLLTVFLGLVLFITLLSFKVPIFPSGNLDQEFLPPFGTLAKGDFPILLLLAESFVFSMAAALWTVVGLAVSAFIPIHFVAIAAPVIASYVLEEMTMFLPNWLNLYYITRSADVIHQGPLVSITYFIFIFILFSVLAGLLFDYQVKRRLRNEVV
ncbi:hypothetical protein CVD25_17910 [Bacillus canaveralius]|uniref:Uncharacterized protein n=1 Tax=Bacillus canaveralius TaxID=1403243 RepID=A0A2N5GST1_9BACI|nr:hypothetical protein [Bacillus canaveralius]PLR86824.1 hypothetical protein CU635_00595 [Bacillus canaveralius]PLR92715.1 hypothetical protein CVD25_17910 [Bacillus canaveralius]RSK53671.1 hypothetical protein EJA13_07630 [Bacillus canaveralius]